MEELISIISNVGFPIFIAMFLLIRVEQKIDTLVSAFVDLTEAITKLMDSAEFLKIYFSESEVRAMAIIVKETATKITLDLAEGTQTISPVLGTATDDAIYNTGIAVGGLLSEAVEAVKLVITETLAEE